MIYPATYGFEVKAGSLAFAMFGYKQNETQFVALLNNHNLKDNLFSIAWRFYLADCIRYRVRLSEQYLFFAPDFISKEHLNLSTSEEFKALEIYLLCTCIDAISGQDDFLSFDQWLQKIGNIGKGEFEDDKNTVAEILTDSGLDLSDPTNFSNLAYRLYDEVYLKRFGNHRAFIRTFDELPIELKQIFIENLFISRPINKDPIRDKKPSDIGIRSVRYEIELTSSEESHF